jgi:hypothetical protein
VTLSEILYSGHLSTDQVMQIAMQVYGSDMGESCREVSQSFIEDTLAAYQVLDQSDQDRVLAVAQLARLDQLSLLDTLTTDVTH